MVFVIVIISSAFSFLLFRSFLLTRVTISDNAVVERIEYNKIGLNMIQANPIFGVRAGESVLHMQQYLPHTNFNNDKNQNYQKLNQQSMPIDSFSSKKLEGGETKLLKPWQKQPIHNYFLLSAAELGIPGALILIWFFLYHLKVLIYKLKASQDFQPTTYYLLLATILCSFFILMLFDHYFYTLQQTQLLLWIILGIIASIKKETLVP
jgi:O-antigen ligase